MQYITQLNEVIFALISSFSVFIGIYYKYKSINLQFDNNRLNKKIESIDFTSSLKISLKNINDLGNHFNDILQKTNVDRVLILIAHNGKNKPRYATAIYEQHKDSGDIRLSIGAATKYIRFEFDEHYSKMLKEIEVEKEVFLSTQEIKSTILGKLYSSENIHHSSVWFLRRINFDAENDVLIFCSLATHQINNFTESEKFEMVLGINHIKSIIDEITV